MNTGAILKQLKAERTRIEVAIKTLEALGNDVARKPGGAKESPTSFIYGANEARGGRRTMSPAARKKLSLMMKKRWAGRRGKT
jgi:hypothetical protein